LTQCNVLIVEDVAESRQMLRVLLLRLGVTVLEAADGLEGVNQALREPPDLILMDLSLPVMDGWQAIAALKDEPATARVPIVIVTAHSSSEDRHRAKLLGCEGWLTKPVDTARVTQIVAGMLRDDYVSQELLW
jgi:CheY-like chemotaxis protein